MKISREADASHPNPYSFRDWVAASQREQTGKRKGERTRDRIRLAAVDLLNEVGYRDLKVSDICDRAQVTPPVLYLYFKGKDALVSNVLEEFLKHYAMRSDSRAARTPYASMLGANLRWIRSARANAGIIKCLLQFSDEQADFAQLFVKESYSWNLRVTRSIIQRFPEFTPREKEIQAIVQILSGMMDEITRRLFSQRDRFYTMAIEEVASSDEELAALLTVIWYRSLFAGDPPADENRMSLPIRAIAPGQGGDER